MHVFMHMFMHIVTVIEILNVLMFGVVNAQIERSSL